VIVVLAPGTGEDGAREVLARLGALGLDGRLVRAGSRALIHVVRGCLGDARVAAIVPTSGPRVRRAGRRFYPYHALRLGAGGLALLALLVALAGFFPPIAGGEPLGAEPDARAIWPWYLAILRGLYDVVPARPTWLAPGAALALLGVVLALPWLDRTRCSSLRARIPVLGAGLLLLGVFAALAAIGLRSPA
jgi:quinol-cytochrome oxidoreductase complex cytochrome b subunit